MELDKIIKHIGCGKKRVRNINYNTAFALYNKILDDVVPDIKLGSILIALRIKGESNEELLGFYQAVQQRIIKIKSPPNLAVPIVIPSYNGARQQSNLTPLLALLLNKLGFPVLIHGVSVEPTRITTKEILIKLGIKPVTSINNAQEELNNKKLTFISIDHLCEPIAKQLSLRWHIGIRNSAHILVKLLTPFEGNTALRIVSVSHLEYMFRVCKFFQTIDSSAILLNGTEGEVYANPHRCPIFKIIHGAKILLEINDQTLTQKGNIILPDSKNANDTAKWTNGVLNGEYSVPQSLRLQLACCLIATRVSSTLEQAEGYLKSFGI